MSIGPEPQSDNNNHEKLTAAVWNTSGNHLVVIRFNSYVTFYMYMYFLLSVWKIYRIWNKF